MNSSRASDLRCSLVAALALFGATLPPLQAQAKKGPLSKIYVTDVSGQAMIDTGEAIQDLSKRSVYTAQGTVIETKKAENESERGKHYSTMVYSNGTGAFFDEDTRVEVRRFVQEPFTPNRTDVEIEPSISQTHAFVARGIVGLCTSKLVAGSTMNYQTPHASVQIRGRKIVIESGPSLTKISMLEGESTVRAGANDVGGRTLKAGEQAIIHHAPAGEPNRLEIVRIPAAVAPLLDDKVAMACLAKKTVYFEERVGTQSAASTGETSADGTVTAFDTTTGGTREIVPVEIVPITLPTEFTVSPARLLSPTR